MNAIKTVSKMKTNAVMTYAYDAPSATLSWLFNDGETLTFTIPGTVPEGNNGHAMVHGYKQKIGDAAAIVRNTETGLPATVADKRAAMAKVIATLGTGQWNAPAGGGGNVGGLLAQAIANVDGRAVDVVRTFLATEAPAQRAAFAAHKKYAKEYKRLQDARLATMTAGVDMEAEMAELNAL